MKNLLLLALLLLLVSTLSFAGGHEKTPPKKPYPFLAGKTVAFVSFASGAQKDALKQQATGFFNKWKRYTVLDDPAQADLIVLIGPLPTKVSGEAFDAVIIGKEPPEAVDVAGAPSQFAVFDSGELRAPTGPVRALWSTPMNGNDVNSAAKKYKEVVHEVQDSYNNSGLTHENCSALGIRCAVYDH